MIIIRPDEVGIVIRKFGSLPREGRIVALSGEAGIQADTLPPGRYFKYAAPFYEVHKVPVVKVPKEEIALVIAHDGAAMTRQHHLGKVVECKNFQDARTFLTSGGQKGRQLDILTDGTYRINTKLFTVITKENAHEYGLQPEDLEIVQIEENHIGIVTTQDGIPLPAGQIAGDKVVGHANFQNAQQFIDVGGQKGLQEEYLTAGKYNLNPWFVQIEQIPVAYIPPGTVGVVISHVGKTSTEATEGILVAKGHKGIWKTPLESGQHPLNMRVMDVQVVPTHEIVLEWSNEDKPATNYDAQLKAIELRSKDGFAFSIKVTQVISINAEDAPKMIAMVGLPITERLSITSDSDFKNLKYILIDTLVKRVLAPLISSHFRNVAQDYTILEFLDKRRNRQEEAQTFINEALGTYGVRGRGTFINEFDLPDVLENVLRRRTFDQEKGLTVETEMLKEITREQIGKLQAESAKQIKMLEVESEILKMEQLVQTLEREGYLSVKWIKSFGKLLQPEGDTLSLNSLLEELILEKGVPFERLYKFFDIDIPNPFIVGQPIQLVEQQVFRGRRDIFYELNNSLSTVYHPPTLVLHGPRRSGKTSLLNQLPEQIPNNMVPISINLQNATLAQNASGFIRYLIATICQQSKKNRHLSLPSPNDTDVDQEPYLAFDRWLTTIETTLSHHILFLAFDEFEWVEKAINRGNLDESILSFFRNLSQRSDGLRLALLFAGVRILDEMGYDWASYFIHAKAVKLGNLSSDEARHLITEPIKDFPLNYLPGTIEAFLEQTQGQPYLTQLVSFEIVNYLNSETRRRQVNRLTVTLNDLEICLQRSLEAGYPYFMEQWQSCSKDEKFILADLAANNPFSSELNQNAQLLALRSLVRKDLIVHNKDKAQIQIPLVARWIRENQPPDFVRATY